MNLVTDNVIRAYFKMMADYGEELQKYLKSNRDDYEESFKKKIKNN